MFTFVIPGSGSQILYNYSSPQGAKIILIIIFKDTEHSPHAKEQRWTIQLYCKCNLNKKCNKKGFSKLLLICTYCMMCVKKRYFISNCRCWVDVYRVECTNISQARKVLLKFAINTYSWKIFSLQYIYMLFLTRI